MSIIARSPWLLAVIFFVTFSPFAWGQHRRFEVTPLVHRITCRTGASVPFEFSVRAREHDTRFRVQSAELSQLETGLMLPTTNRANDTIQVLSTEIVNLKKGETAIIRGKVKAPLSPGAFLPLGVMVTEIAGDTSKKPTGKNPIAVQFVTRYLLRVEVSTHGYAGRQKSLKFSEAKLVSEKGTPTIVAAVENPTEHAVEFSVLANLKRRGEKTGESFYLSLPVRAAEPMPSRSHARVLGKTKVKLIAPIESPLFTGDYDLDLTLVWNRRKYAAIKKALFIRLSDFPAMNSNRLILLESVHVSQPRIELSSAPGGKRLVGLRLANHSDKTVELNLKNDARHWLFVRPSRFVLEPRMSRNLLVGRIGVALQTPQYTKLQVAARFTDSAGDDAIDQREISIANLPVAATKPQGKLLGLKWDSHTRRFAASFSNEGSIHVAPQFRLMLNDKTGHFGPFAAGFGRWALPGETSDYEFAPIDLPPGDYSFTLDMRLSPESQIQQIKGDVKTPAPKLDAPVLRIDDKFNQTKPIDLQ